MSSGTAGEGQGAGDGSAGSSTITPGGGGGSYRGSGQNGFPSGSGGDAGGTYGDPYLTTLHGGSGGGGGGRGSSTLGAGGGGSGGSLWIQTEKLTNSGTILATGGNGGTDQTAGNNNGGAGGNGRIRMDVVSVVANTGTVSPAAGFQGVYVEPPQINSQPRNGTIIFSEDVFNFTKASIAVSPAGSVYIDKLHQVSNSVYLTEFTNMTDSNITSQVGAAAVNDVAVNPNPQGPALEFEFDSTRPQLTLSSTHTYFTRISPIPVAVAFTEHVEMFGVDDFTTRGLAAELESFEGYGSAFAVGVVPQEEGLLTVSVNESECMDLAANTNEPSNTLIFMFDTTQPTTTLTSNASMFENTSPIYILTTFSEPILSSTLAHSDYTVQGSASSLTAVVNASAQSYSAYVYPTSEGVVSINLPADAATDRAGNGNLGSNTLSFTFDTTPPTVDISSLPTTVHGFSTSTTVETNDNPVVVTIGIHDNFDMNYTEFSTINVAGAATLGTISTNATTARNFTATIVPSAQGTPFTVHVPANAVSDTAGNQNLASGSLTFVYDTVAPTVVLTSSSDEFVRESSVDINITFSEEVHGFAGDTDHISVQNCTFQDFTAHSASLYSLTLVPAIEMEFFSIAVPHSVATDHATNQNAASNSLVFLYDTTNPLTTVVSANATGTHTNTSPLQVAINFSENVTAFTAADITLTAGSTVQSLSGGPRYYQALIAPGGEGEISVSVGANRAADVADNNNTASNVVKIIYDTTNPTITVHSDIPLSTNVNPLLINLTASEVVTGLTLGDVVVSSGTKSNFQGSGANYSFELLADVDGQISIHVPGAVSEDLALNPNEASNTLTFTGDFILPTANITSTAPTYTNVAPIPVNFEWSEDTTGFVSGDVSISGGTLSSLSKIGVDYNGTITPAGEGNITLQVPADVCTDIATNPNLASESLMFVYDVTRPSTTASTEEAAKTNKQSIGCKVTFSEPVPDFTAAAVQLGGVGGSVSEFAQGLEGDHVYTFNVSASQEGNVTVFVNAGNTYSPRITDRADNDILASNTLNFLYDTTFPAVTLTLLSELSALDNLSTKNKPIQVQMDTSEPIDGFIGSDLFLGSQNVATDVDITDVFGNATRFLLDINPTDTRNMQSLHLPFGAVHDAASNPNQASNQLNVYYDVTRPEAFLNSTGGTNESPFTLLVDFPETVYGFEAEDVNITGGNLTTFTVVSGSRYSLLIHMLDVEGAVLINIPDDVCKDAADNNNTASNNMVIEFDIGAPTATLSSTADYDTKGSPIPVRVQWNERVYGFAASDVAVVNGAVTGFSGNISTYDLEITPSAEDVVSVSLPSSVILDSAGNANPASGTISFLFDSTQPAVTLSSNIHAFTNDAVIPVTLELSEDVHGFGASNVTVQGGALQNLQTHPIPGSLLRYTFDVVPAAEGELNVFMAGGLVQDNATNPNLPSNTLTFEHDTTRPQLALFPSVSTNTRGEYAIDDGQVPELLHDLDAATSLTILLNRTVEVDFGVPTNVSMYTVRAPALLSPGANVTAFDNCTQTPVAAGYHPPQVFLLEGYDGAAGAYAAVDSQNLTKAEWCPYVQKTFALDPHAAHYSKFRLKVTEAVDSAAEYAISEFHLVRTNSTLIRTNSDPMVAHLLPSEALQLADVAAGNFGLVGTSVQAIANLTGVNLQSGLKGANAIRSLVYPGFAVNLAQSLTPASVEVAAGAMRDLADNLNVQSSFLHFVYDTSAPTVSLTPSTSIFDSDLIAGNVAIFNEGHLDVNITFSEPVYGFTQADIAIQNASISNFAPVLSRYLASDAFSFRLTPAEEAFIEVAIPYGAAEDEATNPSVASATLICRYDTTSPLSAVLTIPTASEFRHSPIIVNATFGEAVLDLSLDDFQFGGVTVTRGSFTQLSVKRFSFEVNPLSEGEITIQLPASAATDRAGNTNTASNQLAFIFDTTQPTVAITTASTNHTNDVPLRVQFTFSEDVYGFRLADIETVEGDISFSSFLAHKNGTSYPGESYTGKTQNFTVDVYPDSTARQNITLRVPADRVQDEAGNVNLASADFRRVYDGVRPTVALTSTARYYEKDRPIPIAIEFSEPVLGLLAEEIVVSNMGATVVPLNLTAEDPYLNYTLFTGGFAGHRTYTANIFPPNEGNLTVHIAGNAAFDISDNGNTASNTLSFIYDSTQPVPTLTADDGGVAGVGPVIPGFTNSTPTDIILSFPEYVSGMLVTDFTATGGDIENSLQAAGTSFLLVVGAASEGTVTIKLDANTVEDRALNQNVESNMLSWVYDITRPGVALATPDGREFIDDSFHIKTKPINVAMTFTELVVGMSNTVLQDFCANCTLSSLSPLNISSSFAVQVQPDVEGDIELHLAAGSIIDKAGNLNTASNTLRIRYDTTNPVPTLHTTARPCTGPCSDLFGVLFYTNVAPIDLEVKFSEPSTDLLSPSFVLTGAANISAFNNITYPGFSTQADLKLMPQGEGRVNISLPADTFLDCATNPNNASNLMTFIYDTTRPEVSLDSNQTFHYLNYKPILFTSNFSEPVEQYNASDLTIDNGAVASQEQVTDSFYRAFIEPAAEGPIYVGIASGVCTDFATNPNFAASTIRRVYDVTRPAVAITSTPQCTSSLCQRQPYQYKTASIPLTFMFNEKVHNFGLDDLSINQGTLYDLAEEVLGSDMTARSKFTARIVPDQDGHVNVTLPADLVLDRAGNLNNASAVFHAIFDATRPTVALTSSILDPAIRQDNIKHVRHDQFPVVAQFSEPIFGFTAEDISVTNGVVANFSDADTAVHVQGGDQVFSFNVVPTNEGHVTVHLPEMIVTDGAVNGNHESNMLFFNYDTTQPTVLLQTVHPLNKPGLHVTNISPLSLNVTFSEPSYGFLAHDLNITNGEVTYFANTTLNHTHFEVQVTPAANGLVVVQVPVGNLTDAALNENIVSNELRFIFDDVPPDVVLTCENANQTRFSPLKLKLDFSEPIYGLETEDFQFTAQRTPHRSSAFVTTGHTVDNLVGNSAYEFTVPPDQEFTFDLTPSITPAYTMQFTMQLPAGMVRDLANNTNVASNVVIKVFDIERPRASVFTSAARPTRVSPIPVFIRFTEKVYNFTVSELEVQGAAIHNFTYRPDLSPVSDAMTGAAMALGAGGLHGHDNTEFYTLDLVPDNDTLYHPTEVSLKVKGDSAASDAAGNLLVGQQLFGGVGTIYDTVRPNGTITFTGVQSNHSCSTDNSTADLLCTIFTPIPIRVEFSEVVTSFEAADLIVTGGEIANLQTASGCEVTASELGTCPSGGTCNQYYCSGAQNLCGVIPPAANYPYNNLYTLSASNTGSGVSSAMSLVSCGSVFTADIVPNVVNDLVTVRIAEDQLQDLAGNLNEAVDTLTIYYDTLPVATILSGPPALTNASSAVIVFNISEAYKYDYKIVSEFVPYNGGRYITGSSEFLTNTSTIVVPSIDEGNHKLVIRAFDETGNTAFTEFDWKTDYTDPRSSIRSKPVDRTQADYANFELAAIDENPIDFFEYQVDGGAYVRTERDQSGPGVLGSGGVTLAFLDLDPGNHTLRVRSKDMAGNLEKAFTSFD